jgi:lysophospholipase L1-like esterase
MHIVCFGDSLTWGKYGGSYVDELAALLPQHQFTNAGIGGDTVVNLLRRVDEDVIQQQPDAVLIMVGGNDAISYLFPATRPYYRQTKHIPNGFIELHEFSAAYRELLSHLQLAHILTWVALPPIEYDPSLQRLMTAYNDAARMIASSFNVATCDLFTALTPSHLQARPPLDMKAIQLIGQRGREKWQDYETERFNGGYTFTFDGLHPTPDGAVQIAKLLAAFIES